MKIRNLATAIGLVCLSGSLCLSAPLPYKYSLSPMLGAHIFEGNQDIDTGFTYGLAAGVPLSRNWDLEGNLTGIDTESDSSRDIQGMRFGLDGLYHFMSESRLRPFLLIGGGGILLNPDPKKADTDFMANYGAGIKYRIVDNMDFRAEVRHVLSFGDDDTFSDLACQAGISWLLGAAKKPVPKAADADGDGVSDAMDQCPGTPAGIPVTQSGCPVDTDGDGIPDYQDQCPDSPAGTRVNASGCCMDTDRDGVPDDRDRCPKTPGGTVVDASGCPMDTDGDGIADGKDQCPDTPAGIAVDYRGCPLDTDGDGVMDSMDSCPDTPLGATVDNRGCWVIKGLRFDSSRAVIKPEFHAILDPVVSVMKNNPKLSVAVEGHTDSRGSRIFNIHLSQKRAQAVAAYLIQHGIAASRVSAEGFGPDRPVADNDTDNDRLENRRVEIRPLP